MTSVLDAVADHLNDWTGYEWTAAVAVAGTTVFLLVGWAIGL